MWENWDELLKQVVIIKWSVVCIAVCLWGVAVYFLLKEIPKWWHSFDEKPKKEKPKEVEKKKKPFTLEQMNRDLAGATRYRDRDRS